MAYEVTATKRRPKRFEDLVDKTLSPSPLKMQFQAEKSHTPIYFLVREDAEKPQLRVF